MHGYILGFLSFLPITFFVSGIAKILYLHDEIIKEFQKALILQLVLSLECQSVLDLCYCKFGKSWQPIHDHSFIGLHLLAKRMKN